MEEFLWLWIVGLEVGVPNIGVSFMDFKDCMTRRLVFVDCVLG